MSKSCRKRVAREAIEANLIPVLSCMFVLIPALLLAMEVAPFSSVTVSPPRLSNATVDDPPAKPDHVRIRVTIRADGLQAELRRSGAPGPDIKTFPMTDDAHDFVALQAFARALKREFPGTSSVELTAEGDVRLGTVVETMDALRGDQCSLAEASGPSAGADDCLLWQVVVTS